MQCVRTKSLRGKPTLTSILILASICALALPRAIGPATAQDHSFSLTSASGVVGSDVTLTNLYDNNSTEGTFFYNFGNCIVDPTIVDIVAVAEGLNSTGTPGDMAAFYGATLFPGEGWTFGVVISLIGDNLIPAGSLGNELAVATYTLLAPGVSAIDYCDSLDLDIDIHVGNTASETFPVAVTSGSIEAEAQPPLYIFRASDTATAYDTTAGSASFEVDFSIEQDPFHAAQAPAASGFTMAVRSAPLLLTPLAVEDLLGSEFFLPTLVTDGWGAEVSYDSDLFTMPFLNPTPVLRVTYETVPAAFIGVTGESSTPLDFDSALISPTGNSVNVIKGSVVPTLESGVATLTGIDARAFIRADCANDGSISLPDALFLLSFLFTSGADPICAAACDVDFDNNIGITDALSLLNFLFLGGQVPVAPFPSCGVRAGLPCDASDCP